MSPEPDLVGEFLARVVDVLREAAGVDTSLALACRADAPDRIAVLIHAHGDLSGLTWWFPVELARRVALRMLPGIDPDPSICDAAAAELANVLTGRGLVYLAEQGFYVEIEPPEISAVPSAGAGGVLGTEVGPIEVVFHASDPAHAARRLA